jgi:predicted amidohydrolase YtcJ
VILENGVVRTMDASLPRARALAIAGDRVAGGVGTHETALASPEVVDLGGRCVLPAFTDAHVHFPTWALAQRQVRLDRAGTLDETLALVGDAARAVEPGNWLRGLGWSFAVGPTLESLDAVTGDVPTALVAHDHHSLWLNTAGLARGNGEFSAPDGILREEAAWDFFRRYAQAPDDDYVAAMRDGLLVAASRGVGAVHDKDGGIGALRFWQRLQRDGALTLRVWQSLPHDRLDAIDGLVIEASFGDDRLRAGYLKVFMDGTLGSGTARMLDGSGFEITSRAELADIVRRAARAGWPVAVHAIGDRANRDALDAFEETSGEWRPRRLRQRIEHAQCLSAQDLGRFASLGVAASVQFSHAPSDRDLADRDWPEHEGAYAYAYRSLVDSGAVVANGSDAPIEELDPLAGIRAGVLRTLDARDPWRASEAVTVEQALHAATVAPAWLSGDERRRGKLLPGFLADLVVLDRDPLAIRPDELGDVRVVATMVGGRWTHNPPPWDRV